MVVYLFYLSAQEADTGGLSLRERLSQTNKLMTSILSLFAVEYDKVTRFKAQPRLDVCVYSGFHACTVKKQCQTLNSKQIPFMTVVKGLSPLKFRW